MEGQGPDISVAIPAYQSIIYKWSISVTSRLYRFPGMYRQMVVSFKGEIYFGPIPTLILFLMLLYVG